MNAAILLFRYKRKEVTATKRSSDRQRDVRRIKRSTRELDSPPAGKHLRMAESRHQRYAAEDVS